MGQTRHQSTPLYLYIQNIKLVCHSDTPCTAICVDPANFCPKPKSANPKAVEMNLIMWLQLLLGFPFFGTTWMHPLTITESERFFFILLCSIATTWGIVTLSIPKWSQCSTLHHSSKPISQERRLLQVFLTICSQNSLYIHDVHSS